MINNPKDSDNFPLKQEGLSSRDHNPNNEKAKAPTPPPSSSSSSQWLRLKDPRIVRVSRAFGGKDRHSKVYTIRGLRDRRVRLSVPTAISLYDLQDRLGLSQPSKVVDWLLNAAKHEIDELPPLPSLVPSLVGNNNNFTLGFPSLLGTSNNNDVNAIWKLPKSKEVISREEILVNDDEEEEEQEEVEEDNKEGECGGVLPNSNVVLPSSSRPNNLIPSFLGLVNTMPFSYQWEINSSSSSSSCDVVAAQLGNHHHHHHHNCSSSDHHMHHSSINVVPFPSNLGGSQILVCPPPGATTTTQSYFPSHNHLAAAMEMDPRQMINTHHHYHQLLMNSSVNPSHHHQHHHHLMMTRMTPKLFHSANTTESQSQHNKDHDDFPSK